MKLVPFPNSEDDMDVVMSDSEPHYFDVVHSRLQSNASSISSTASDSSLAPSRMSLLPPVEVCTYPVYALQRQLIQLLTSTPSHSSTTTAPLILILMISLTILVCHPTLRLASSNRQKLSFTMGMTTYFRIHELWRLNLWAGPLERTALKFQNFELRAPLE